MAEAIAAKAARGVPLAQAVKEANAPLPPVRPIAARRIQIAMAKDPVPPAMQMLFTLAQGKSKIVADPQGRALFVVKVDKITPGNALLQPNLISQMQNELQQSASDDYARQFVAALRQDMKAKRNEFGDPGAEDPAVDQRRLSHRRGLDPRRFVAYTFPVRSYGE